MAKRFSAALHCTEKPVQASKRVAREFRSGLSSPLAKEDAKMTPAGEISQGGEVVAADDDFWINRQQEDDVHAFVVCFRFSGFYSL
ncbi:hypothetical protein HNY73_004378 [Argiope bruennichi]|uniref:Uncharacterized protein n=1 Tax=Argiope bruennichi TaxID=94029 RepID=A0A8T0FR91_ARGBR|nr:hypothetical protein HNY73_004378 [Argiope bruennichi]